jgi:hypothetical protein
MRKRSWTTWLAFRSLITGLVALVAAYMVDSAALPRLASESRGLEKTASVPAILGTIQPYLMHIPATAVGIALMAVMIRSLRGILAPIAAILSVVAVAAVIGVFLGALRPLYG